MAFRIAISGFFALVVAMGIGRFSFTPQVPLMIAEHQFSLTAASLVAALNYLGYLFGAYDAMKASRNLERRLWLGVWGTVLLTLVSAFVSGSIAIGIIRFLSGWASGWAMVLVSSWCSEQLAHHGRHKLSVAVFAGPCVGIFLSGIVAVGIHSLSLNSSEAWGVYGVLTLVLAAAITINLPRKGELHRTQLVSEPFTLTPALKRLLIAYSLGGFGYILPATFLSQIANARFPDSLFAQFVWPVFGGAGVLGIVIGMMTQHLLTTQKRLAIVFWIQALGILCAEIIPGVNGLVVSALLVGGGLMLGVQLTIHYSRELAPSHSRYMAGLLTTGYAIGQLVGPILSSLTTKLTGRLEPALYVAIASFLIAGLLVVRRGR